VQAASSAFAAPTACVLLHQLWLVHMRGMVGVHDVSIIDLTIVFLQVAVWS
jgi:hypothetical protein